MRNSIDSLKRAAGSYKIWALKARKKFIDLRRQQDYDIQKIYTELIMQVSKELRKSSLSRTDKQRLMEVYKELKKQENILKGQLTINFDNYLKENIETSLFYAKEITINAIELSSVKKISKDAVNNIFFKVNNNAVKAMWIRKQQELYLSDRIWTVSKNYRKTIGNIITQSVADGRDCVKTAKALEQYVLKGKRTLCKEYPNMIKRMKSRIPENLNYEALRLARTEMTAAYGEGTMAAARNSPGCKGVQFILSGSHPKMDICDEICGSDKHGLGIGVYPVDSAPVYPFHPNCLCITLAKQEEPEALSARLKNWEKNPNSDPQIEAWYQNIYKKMK